MNMSPSHPRMVPEEGAIFILIPSVGTRLSCGEPTGVSNKLWVWVWHSPKPQKGANIVMSNKLHTWIGTASAAEVGKMQYSCFFL
jgi:hypothetical protein